MCLRASLSGLVLLAAIGTSAPARAEPEGPPPPPSPPSPTGEGASVVRDQVTLMSVLSGWALASVASGVVMATSNDDGVRFAGIQNIAWGAIDGALAGIALATTKTPTDPVAARRQLSRIFAINAAIDVAYITAGVLMTTLGKDDRVVGSGAAVIVQGGFLLGFDGIAALIVRPR
ncbi:MAG: hypothetical protein JST00_36225 [Deltaproteobacteria bacterium]|nr:hypothetical protein [Deltaproteobacteria bacterium]